MQQENRRIILFTGHFGSGKTELAINYSIKLARQGQAVTVVDLDIVNPFFRSSEVRDVLEKEGIRLLSPNFVGTTVDVPSLPPEIYSVFQSKNSKVIFDVGGDDIGATALGRYYPYFMQEPYRMFFVINARRPLSSTPEQIIEMLKAIESHSRLKVTDLINNTNLMYETNLNHLLEGQEIVEQVSEKLNIPIAYISGVAEVIEQLPEQYNKKGFPIDIYLHPPWDREDEV
ncbi:MAG: hypothetical protein PWR01_1692 [Clostridiales bacterium]|jgi:hypothetical protein|uniref:CobQ/CobB/MinD/ParA nucleotide binding domain-containing protein n=1 Tax=Caldicoprobacter faecalis TaxID=937334 RepID=A0A1I5UN36_9FIRM|nr:hypothetical protein [Caldicoprobacter faecalis]MDN5277727.1 hypothetical protein [Clostridiales bacterium]SFP96006.1 hypothetical protein SAMN05444406_10784 [Caldicoprobacter faecalis]